MHIYRYTTNAITQLEALAKAVDDNISMLKVSQGISQSAVPADFQYLLRSVDLHAEYARGMDGAVHEALPLIGRLHAQGLMSEGAFSEICNVLAQHLGYAFVDAAMEDISID